ncbi:response regulator transcription factor [Microvirga sp. VF16]|uniref:response regulator n=1 Tax=Microvirga sp. VF16 TaxID=2807101 RepID=UPI00193E6BA1|nr:response regulator transcription factor [Microvirga sp. VF16]QRM29104.1 response regulator transcription factor [Microvirga sp. VF16]QRM34329.1 response regulator transcription factor [Microvirga sp. VF16]
MTIKLLVADDHAIVRRGLQALLEAQAGWQVCAEADDGQSAVDLAGQHRPDVAILDYALPGLNGLEATRHMRLASPGTEVLIYTMHNNDDVIRDVLRAGARGYLLKTEDDTEVVRAVRALLRKQPYFSPQVAETLLDTFLSGGKVVASQTLSSREREVIQLVAEGQSNRDIAERWKVSIKTVESHRTSAMKKLNLRSGVELALYAVRNKLIEP